MSGIIEENRKVELLRRFETSTVPIADFFKQEGVGKATIYTWRKELGMDGQRGSPKNMKRLEKYSPIQAPPPQEEPKPQKTAAVLKGRTKYPEDVKQAALAEYNEMLANDETARGAERAVREKYNLGHGVLNYWRARQLGKPRAPQKKRASSEVIQINPVVQEPAHDLKGAITFLRHAIDAMGNKRPIELNDQDLLTLHALRALTGKGRV